MITFRGGLTQAGKAWTDSDELSDERDLLKWRAEAEVRRVTVPPELFDATDEHIAAYGLAPDGRIFTNSAGSPISKTFSDAWRPCVVKRFPAPHPFCDLRPYDLRHVHASALIAEGMSPPKIAKRLGHSVTVLLETYAGFFDDEDDAERSPLGL